MTSPALALLVVAGAAAVTDWIAVARQNKALEYAAKPLTTLALLGAAVTLDPGMPARRWLFVTALGFSLVGDVFLMLRNERFLAGLGAFLVAHLAYIAGLSRGGSGESLSLVVAAVIVATNAALTGRAVLRSAPQTMRTPLVLYMLALSVMVLLALTRGPALAIAAALLFLASDSLLGVEKFVTSRPWMRLGVIVTYHLAQGAFVLSLV